MQSQMALATVEETLAEKLSPAAEPQIHWNIGLKIAFRFAFSYFILYCFPFPLGYFPYTNKLSQWYELGWHKVVPWVAAHYCILQRQR